MAGHSLDRRTLLAASLVALSPAAALAASPTQQSPQPPLPPPLSELDARAPVTRPSGASTTLSENLQPAPTLISFWATWCAPCIGEARYLARVRTRTAAERLNIIGINMDYEPRDEREISRFLWAVGANYTQLRGVDRTFRAFDRSPRLSLPRLYVFRADGVGSSAFGGFDGRTIDIDRAIERVMAPA